MRMNLTERLRRASGWSVCVLFVWTALLTCVDVTPGGQPALARLTIVSGGAFLGVVFLWFWCLWTARRPIARTAFRRGVCVLCAGLAAIACGSVWLVLTCVKPLPPLEPETLEELLNLSQFELERVELGRMNILCAEGLPGIETVRFPAYFAKLDAWAAAAKRLESVYLPRYRKNAARYDNSRAKFKAVNLGMTVQQDLKCRYNPELLRSGVMDDVKSPAFFRNPKDLFICGLLENGKGSCASLPVLTAALGRRLGYPLRLATTKGHLFCRWNDTGFLGERFNLEVSSAGVDSFPDSYYRQFPFTVTEQDVEDEKYLKSLHAFEALSIFMENRALCLFANGDVEGALEAVTYALRARPQSRQLAEYRARWEGRVIRHAR